MVEVLLLAGAQVTTVADLANWANTHGVGGCSKSADSQMIDVLVTQAKMNAARKLR